MVSGHGNEIFIINCTQSIFQIYQRLIGSAIYCTRSAIYYTRSAYRNISDALGRLRSDRLNEMLATLSLSSSLIILKSQNNIQFSFTNLIVLLSFAKNNAVLCTTCNSAVLHLRLINISAVYWQFIGTGHEYIFENISTIYQDWAALAWQLKFQWCSPLISTDKVN